MYYKKYIKYKKKYIKLKKLIGGNRILNEISILSRSKNVLTPYELQRLQMYLSEISKDRILRNKPNIKKRLHWYYRKLEKSKDARKIFLSNFPDINKWVSNGSKPRMKRGNRVQSSKQQQFWKAPEESSEQQPYYIPSPPEPEQEKIISPNVVLVICHGKIINNYKFNNPNIYIRTAGALVQSSHISHELHLALSTRSSIKNLKRITDIINDSKTVFACEFTKEKFADTNSKLINQGIYEFNNGTVKHISLQGRLLTLNDLSKNYADIPIIISACPVNAFDNTKVFLTKKFTFEYS